MFPHLQPFFDLKRRLRRFIMMTTRSWGFPSSASSLASKRLARRRRRRRHVRADEGPLPPLSAFEKRIHHAFPRQHAVLSMAKCLTNDADFSRTCVFELLKAACQWDSGSQEISRWLGAVHMLLSPCNRSLDRFLRGKNTHDMATTGGVPGS